MAYSSLISLPLISYWQSYSKQVLYFWWDLTFRTADKVNILFRELIETYLSCSNLFFHLGTVVSMLFSSALERSNNPHIELIVQTFVSKNQIYTCHVYTCHVYLIGKKILKKCWGKGQNVSMRWKQNKCVWERQKWTASKLL